MRANILAVAATNAVLLAAAAGIAMAEHLTRPESSNVAAGAAEQGEPRPGPSHDDGEAVVTAMHGLSAERQGPQPSDEPEDADSGHGRPDPSEGSQGQASEPASEPDMGRAAAVVAACESGKRYAHGTPMLGSHRWHISNSHGGTDSGAFQFLDSTWQRVAAEIGASQYERAKHAPPEVQLEAFWWLWRRDRGAWDASRSCWERLLGR